MNKDGILIIYEMVYTLNGAKTNLTQVVTWISMLYLQVSTFLRVEGHRAYGCYDNQHAQRDRHKKHDNMFATVHQLLVFISVLFGWLLAWTWSHLLEK